MKDSKLSVSPSEAKDILGIPSYSDVTSKDFGNVINLQSGIKQMETIGLVSMLEEMEDMQRTINNDVNEVAKFGGSTTEHHLS